MNRPDNTRKQQGRGVSGQSGNPAGRPKGSRNKHSENFVIAFARDFEQHGAAVIETVRTQRPHDYLRIAASLLPQQMEIETSRSRPLAELSDAELITLVAEGTEVVVEKVLISRGHARLTIEERQRLPDWEQSPAVTERLAGRSLCRLGVASLHLTELRGNQITLQMATNQIVGDLHSGSNKEGGTFTKRSLPTYS